jgi:chloramphenicol 3-O-phosphotransferase
MERSDRIMDVPAVSALLVMGPVSSGKTSLGRALQAIAAEPWLLWEADACQPAFPFERFSDQVTSATERALTRASLSAAHAYVDAGFKVFAELGLAHLADRDAAREIFGAGALTVIVVCDRSLVERRTMARADRDLAWALRYYDSFNWHALEADIRLQSDDRNSEDLARDLIDRLQQQ